ncbi:hypothetical protein EPN95_02060 [Patescibacteria group bacterium]|nr:MAG: hypothetical protein EPN95_02060 [Patescibacteria group bacterium]
MIKKDAISPVKSPVISKSENRRDLRYKALFIVGVAILFIAGMSFIWSPLSQDMLYLSALLILGLSMIYLSLEFSRKRFHKNLVVSISILAGSLICALFYAIVIPASDIIYKITASAEQDNSFASNLGYLSIIPLILLGTISSFALTSAIASRIPTKRKIKITIILISLILIIEISYLCLYIFLGVTFSLHYRPQPLFTF